MATKPSRDQQYRIVMLMALALFIAAPAVYLVVVYYIGASQPAQPEPNKFLMYLLLAIGILQATIVLPFLTRFLLQNPRHLAQDASSPNSPATALVIIRMALVESIFIYGVVYFLITHETSPLLYFYAIGALAVALNWPTRDRFDEIANALEGK